MSNSSITKCLDISKCDWFYCKENNSCLLHDRISPPQKIIVTNQSISKSPLEPTTAKGKKRKTRKQFEKNRKAEAKKHIVPATAPHPVYKFEVKKNQCFWCELRMDSITRQYILTDDHIHPQSKGGTRNFHNIVPSCRDCNYNKRSLLVHEWLEYIQGVWTVDGDMVYVGKGFTLPIERANNIIKNLRFAISKLYPEKLVHPEGVEPSMPNP